MASLVIVNLRVARRMPMCQTLSYGNTGSTPKQSSTEEFGFVSMLP